jgi:hypothetical protein
MTRHGVPSSDDVTSDDDIIVSDDVIFDNGNNFRDDVTSRDVRGDVLTEVEFKKQWHNHHAMA